jgi:hypothetical protein
VLDKPTGTLTVSVDSEWFATPFTASVLAGGPGGGIVDLEIKGISLRGTVLHGQVSVTPLAKTLGSGDRAAPRPTLPAEKKRKGKEWLMSRQLAAVIVAVVCALGILPTFTLAAPASVNHTTYLFQVGSPGFVTLPDSGPDVSRAPNGSTVSMMGTGSFTAGPDKSVSGSGTYVIKDASGATLHQGSWTATQMLGFVNYGSGSVQGLPAFLYGGQATMMVNLSGVGSGVLNINCTLGTPPPGHNAGEEGIDLMLGNGLTFNREVMGDTVFINPAQMPSGP